MTLPGAASRDHHRCRRASDFSRRRPDTVIPARLVGAAARQPVGATQRATQRVANTVRAKGSGSASSPSATKPTRASLRGQVSSAGPLGPSTFVAGAHLLPDELHVRSAATASARSRSLSSSGEPGGQHNLVLESEDGRPSDVPVQPPSAGRRRLQRRRQRLEAATGLGRVVEGEDVVPS